MLVVYNEIQDPSIKKMNKIIDASVILVFSLYLISGLFGYIAFYNFHIHGNILTNIPNTFVSEIMVFGFIVCCLFGYPFMVYPCRTSLNTLMFSEVILMLKLRWTFYWKNSTSFSLKVSKDNIETEVRITETNFKNLTYGIIFITTLSAILIPNSMALFYIILILNLRVFFKWNLF